jgi:phosphoserine aminotransferase
MMSFANFNPTENVIPTDPRFGCGPSLVPVSYLESLAKTGKHLMGTSHRKSAVKNVVKNIQDGLRQYFQLPEDYSIVLGNGGATFLFDMITLGLVEKKVLHYTCGEFSRKWFEFSAKVPWVSATEETVPVGSGIDPHMKAGFDTICCTLNETSTGVQIAAFPHQRQDDALLVVDATSGGGQVPCDIRGVDVFFFSPQKVFASDGGLFIAIMSPRARARALAIEALHDQGERYIPGIMSWKNALENSDKNQTYNTPAIATLFFMQEQVKAMNAFGGYQAVIKAAKEKADFIYAWAKERPYLTPYVGEEKYRSIAVATIDVSDQYPIDELLGRLEKLKLVYGIDSYRKLGRNQMRIGLFHNISLDDIKKLTQLIDQAISQYS